MRRHHPRARVVLARLPGDQLPAFDQLPDATLDMIDRDAFQPEVEGGLAEQVDVEGRLPLRQHPDGRRDGKLRARLGRRLGDAAKAAVDQRIVRTKDPSQLVPRARDRVRDGPIATLEGTAGRPFLRAGKCRVEQPLAIEAERRGLLDPVPLQSLAILNVQLWIAGVGGDAVTTLGRGDAKLGRLLQDRLPALAERFDDRLRHAGDLEGAVLALELHLVAELLHLLAQEGVVDRADHGVVAPDLVGMERLPLAVGHLGQVGDHGVDVRLRVQRAAGVMLEQGENEVPGLHRHLAALDVLAALREVAFDPPHCPRRGLHGGAVLTEDALVAGDVGQHRYRLRRGEGQVDA